MKSENHSVLSHHDGFLGYFCPRTNRLFVNRDQVLRKEMTYKLDGFKDKLEQVIDCVELENEKCDHSGTRSSSSSMVVSYILYLVCFVVIFCTFQL